MGRIVALLLSIKRWVAQATAFLFFNSYLFPWLKHMPCPALNCHSCPLAVFACPIGTIQHFGIIHKVPFYTIGLLGVIGALFGRLNCGWFCPFGFLQDLLYKIKVPKLKLSNRLGWIRYFVLIVLVGLIPVLTLESWFCKLCPAGTIEAGIPQVLLEAQLRAQIGWFFGLKIAILASFLMWMIFTKRPFCRFVCPLGAIYSVFNRFSALQLSVDQARCNRCNLCQQVCPTDIKIYENPNSTQCIRCLDCIKVCPTSAISYRGISREEDQRC